MRFAPSPNKQNAYSALAPLYDRIMAHVDYDAWVALIGTVLARYYRPSAAGERASIVEIGGGTGTLAHLLQQAGYRYTGSDGNFSMCQQALRKGIPFTCCNGLFLPFKGQFDCAIFLYDGINYLHELSDYGRLFTGLLPLLKKEGLFLFDVTTQYNSIKYFRDFTDYNEWADYACVRHSYYREAQQLQYNDFSIWQRLPETAEAYGKRNERHVQKVFAIPELCEQVPLDKFDIVGVWDNFSLKKWTSRSERVHVLLKKL